MLHNQRKLYNLMPGLLALILLAGILFPQTIRADGIPIPPYGHEADVDMPTQKAIIVYDEQNGHQDLILSIKLFSQSSEIAWIVPTPSRPFVSTASAEWFSHLSDLTQPEIKERFDPFIIPMMGGAASKDAGVELISREQVGVYDVSVLSAEKPDALIEWLNENGYAFPQEGQSILDAYVQEGWYFVATRVTPGQDALVNGDVQPLWLSFDAQQPVYPMRLTFLIGQSIDLLLYVLSDHRVEIEGDEFATEFAGQLTLEPVSSKESDLADILTYRPYYVTKLRSEYYAQPDQDLYFHRAANDESYRRIVYEDVTPPCLYLCYCPLCCCALVVVLFAFLGLTGLSKLARLCGMG